MSTKYVVAAAALATVAVTQAEGTKFSIDKIKRPLPVRPIPIRTLPIQLDAEQADWNFNAGIQGGAGGKPQWNVGIGAKWEEEEQRWGPGFPGSSTGPYNPTPPFSPFEEEQKLRLSKVVKGIKKVNNVVNKAQQVGLLDEEQADWNFNAGIQGGAGGKPQWNVGIGAKWEEEEQILGSGRGFPIHSTGPYNPGPPPFLPFEEEQKLRLSKVVKGIEKVNNVINKAEQVGLLEEEEAKANWNFNAGVSGGAGGKPQWNVGIGATWDEEQKVLPHFPIRSTGPYNPGPPPFLPFEEEQKLRLSKVVKGIKKVNNVVNKAQQVGLLDEEQADWNFNAGIQGGAGGKPQWQVGIGAKWDEEQRHFEPRPYSPMDEEQRHIETRPYSPMEEEQGFGSKLDKFIGRVDNTLTTIDRVKGLFDEEEQMVQASELIKLKRTCLKAKKTLKAAVESKLLDEDEEQGFGSKLDRTLGRIDNTLNTIDRVKGLFQ